MFLDASAIIAILAREPDAQRYADAIDAAQGSLIVSPLAIFEATTGLARAKSRGMAFLQANSVQEVVVNANIGRGALEAAGQFGRVVGHPAELNFGDCFAYACAKDYRVPCFSRAMASREQTSMTLLGIDGGPLARNVRPRVRQVVVARWPAGEREEYRAEPCYNGGHEPRRAQADVAR